jgi:hypothetical protein
MRILMLLCVAPILNAQGGGAPWNDLRSKNPPGVSVTLQLLNPHAFRQGELIAADISPVGLPVPQPKPATEFWTFAGILLDPPLDCGSVSKPCWPSEPNGGGLNGSRDDHGRPLNSYLPPLAPGRYQVAALARKMVRSDCGLGSTCYRDADPAQYAVSDTVEIEIVAATTDWVRQTIARSAATLNGPQANNRADYEAQRNAAWQLALLNDPAAWTASLELLPKEEAVLLRGLAQGRPAARVCDLMQARVSAPAQFVSTSYLHRLTEICAAANFPPAPAVRADGMRPTAVISTTRLPSTAPVALPDPDMQAWGEKRQAYTEDLMNKAAAALAGSLAGKQQEAKSEAFWTLLQEVNQLRVNRPQDPDPAWIPMVAGEFMRDFAGIETSRKQSLLDLYGSTIQSREGAPFFESVLDSWKPGDYYEAAHSALRGLYRLDPARAHARILAELAKEKTWLDVASLEMLPASAVKPMDDALIEALARAQRPGGWNPQLIMAAIARFATPKALPRIRAIYESQQDRCEPELVAYFVRADPGYAERIFHSHTWNMHASLPQCTVQYFQRIPPLAMSAGLEQYIAAYLMHSDVYIKSTAARVLARYGSPAALAPLWESFRYFHDYWNGKGEELTQNGQGVELEVDLRNAIAHGLGWLATEDDLRLIESLCISGRCIQETRQDLEYLQTPLRIEIMPQTFGMFGRIAQYYGLESIAAMESKLAQFPRGTQFVLHAPGGQSATISEIRRFATEKGLGVSP